jgi:hypothetical protein
MNKIIKVAGLLAAGAAISSVGVSAEEGGNKVYTLNAGLRGFYDDNIFTGNNKSDLNGDGKPDRRKFASSGFEVTPGVRLSVPLEQSLVSVGVTYGLRYYENRPGRAYDQFLLADAKLDHTFSERYSVSVFDNFAWAQEPSQLNPTVGTLQQVLRAEGDNIRNTAGFDFTATLTPLWSAVVGYRNTLFDFKAEQYKEFLNRLEMTPSLSLRYQLSRQTVVSGNYQFSDVDYDFANFRDSRSQYAFGGVDHSFSQRLSGAVRVGAQFVDWIHATPGYRSNAVNPYADASLTYAYATGSNVQLGVRHGRNATDLSGVLDQESTLVYSSVNHQITGALRASLVGQYQNAAFVGIAHNAGADGLAEDFVSVGGTLSYRLNAYLSTEASYYFDRLSSGIHFRDYTRNRVFVGFRATY